VPPVDLYVPAHNLLRTALTQLANSAANGTAATQRNVQQQVEAPFSA
jgi:hypothetical protein